jgi:FkbM family methyltransferase
MFRNIKTPIQKVLHQAGYDIHRRKPDDWNTLRRYSFRTILDIGANRGQFARRIRPMYPGAMIHSFEPIRGAYELLSESFAADQRFQAHRIALGETCGSFEMYENEQTDFSSLLPMNSTCREDFPSAGDETPTQIQMMRLDRWAETQTLDDPLLIKIDVQGYEDRVIKGGVETVKRAHAILTEVTFKPLYRCQPLFHDLYLLLYSLGFKLTAVVNNMYDVSEMNILQADAIFETRLLHT